MAKFCKHCGNELKEGTKFCAKCGTSTGVISDDWVCPACGHENKKGKFCAKCGGGKPEEVPAASVETLAPPSEESSTVPVEAPALQPIPLEPIIPPSEAPPLQSEENKASNVQSSVSGAWTCPACGHENVKGKFCAKCGGGKPGEGVTAPTEAPAPTSEAEATKMPPPPLPETPAAVPPPPTATQITPTEATQSDAFAPPIPAAQKASGNKKLPILLAVLVVVAVAVFFGSGKLMESYYASKSEECAAILTESKTLLDNLAELPADAASDDVKKIADGLKKNAEKLESIKSGIVSKLPRKPQQEKAWNAIAKNAELLSQMVTVVQSQERAFNPASIKRFSVLCDECMSKWDEANAAATETTVKNQPLADLVPYAEIKKDLQTYRRNKQAFDAKFAQEKYNELRQARQAAQEELKKSSEVVFLADSAYKNGSDLIVEGRFYNGTPDLVTGVIDMQVDVKLSLWETEVQSLKDESYTLNLSGLQLLPQQATGAVQLRLQGKAPEGDFNNFEADIHKIRWSRMKARS